MHIKNNKNFTKSKNANAYLKIAADKLAQLVGNVLMCCRYMYIRHLTPSSYDAYAVQRD